mmetsp:Transcript_9261/g.9624  ORF Transcript_9261/g.9624 Transcript_9261/m.9624 type:complete len:849 (+) Transcript_9261:1-2547(+)
MKSTSQTNPNLNLTYNEEILEIIPLGSGSEVGRSCLFLKFADIKIMLDCGIHPAHNGIVSLPYFDIIDPAEIDLLLITHFHLDHCGALPYFLTKTNFKGKCYMTQPTKELYKFLISDYIKVSHVKTEESLYNENDLETSYFLIQEIDFKQTISLSIRNKNIKFTAYNAGHVLGAAMFHIEIEEVSILYTGDFSREEDRHLQPADLPNIKVNVLIVESTYGIQKHDPRPEREQIFKKLVTDVIRRRGKCLLPVMISGRVQELLLILEECWAKEENKDLRPVKIFFVSSLAAKCLDIFKKNINIMGEKIKRNHLVEGARNPFEFEYIISVKNMEEMLMKGYDENKPVVVFASPGMLQQGLSRDLFEKWYDSDNNATIITGYCVEGTFAKELLKDHEEIKLTNGRKVKLNMKVHNVTFSAHCDFNDTSGFIEHLKPKKIVLVHGENREMKRFKEEMERRIKVNYENQYSSNLVSAKGKTVGSSSNNRTGLVAGTSIVGNNSSGNTSNTGEAFLNSKIYNPQNCQRVQFGYKIQRTKNVFIVGDLYNKISRVISLSNTSTNSINNNTSNMLIDSEHSDHNPTADNINNEHNYNEDTDIENDNFIEFNGVLIEDKLMFEDEIEQLTDLTPMKLRNIIQIPYTKDFTVLFDSLQSMFQFSIALPNCLFNDFLEVKLEKDSRVVVLNWVSSRLSDSLADSVAQIVYQLEKFPNLKLAQNVVSNVQSLKQVQLRLYKYFSSKYIVKLSGGETHESLIGNLRSSHNKNNEGESRREEGKYSIVIYSSEEYKEKQPICEVDLMNFEMVLPQEELKESSRMVESSNSTGNSTSINNSRVLSKEQKKIEEELDFFLSMIL